MNSRIVGGKNTPQQVVFRRDGSARTAGAISRTAGGYAIADTSTTARVGDLYRAETATTSVMVTKEYHIIEASTNSFTIASEDAPTLGDTFYILGKATLRTTSDGSLAATVSGGATEAKQDAAAVLTGAVTEVAPASDTASSGLNGRLQRIAQRITSLIALLPASLGAKAAASSLATTLSTEDVATLNTLLKPADTLTAVTAVTTVGAVTSITNALPAGTNNIGDVDVLTLPALVAGSAIIGKVGIDQTTPGTTNLVALAANQTVNVAQINGVTPLMGAGNTGTGSPRVTIATDQATLPTAEVPSSGSTNALSRAATTSLATNLVVKATAGRLYSLVVTNTKTSSQYIQIHNTASLPADTAVPIHSILVPPQSSMSLSDDAFGDYYTTGITVCNSSTAATKTIGAADLWIVARYL